MENEREGFPITSLREINTLLKAQHPNIVTVRVRTLSYFFKFKCLLYVMKISLKFNKVKFSKNSSSPSENTTIDNTTIQLEKAIVLRVFLSLHVASPLST